MVEVGKYYKIKKYDKRPDFWNGQGEMDRYMGRVVKVTKVGREGHFNIEQDANDQGFRWTFFEQNIEKEIDIIKMKKMVDGDFEI